MKSNSQSCHSSSFSTSFRTWSKHRSQRSPLIHPDNSYRTIYATIRSNPFLARWDVSFLTGGSFFIVDAFLPRDRRRKQSYHRLLDAEAADDIASSFRTFASAQQLSPGSLSLSFDAKRKTMEYSWKRDQRDDERRVRLCSSYDRVMSEPCDFFALLAYFAWQWKAIKIENVPCV